MAIAIATLGGDDLPIGFSYRPYIQRKRNTIIPTANGVVVQSSDPQIVHGDGTLAFRIRAGFPNEFQDLYDKYNTTIPFLYTFVGYWGETLEVYFTSFDTPQVRGRLFNMAGQFQVIEVTTDYSALCNPG